MGLFNSHMGYKGYARRARWAAGIKGPSGGRKFGSRNNDSNAYYYDGDIDYENCSVSSKIIYVACFVGIIVINILMILKFNIESVLGKFVFIFLINLFWLKAYPPMYLVPPFYIYEFYKYITKKKEASVVEDIVKAPYEFRVLEIYIAEGQEVQEGEFIMKIYYHKNYYSLQAQKTGTIDKIFVKKKMFLRPDDPIYSYKI